MTWRIKSDNILVIPIKIVKTDERRNYMSKSNTMMNANDIAKELGVSVGKAYKIIRDLNQELKKQNYIVVAGKIPKAFWRKKFYNDVA